jgi:hypothetical protein
MTMISPASRHTSGSDLNRVDAHVVQPNEYEKLPELTEDMLSRAVFKTAGQANSESPHSQATQTDTAFRKRK